MFVKIAQYIDFWVYRRSYLIWPPRDRKNRERSTKIMIGMEKKKQRERKRKKKEKMRHIGNLNVCSPVGGVYNRNHPSKTGNRVYLACDYPTLVRSYEKKKLKPTNTRG